MPTTATKRKPAGGDADSAPKPSTRVRPRTSTSSSKPGSHEPTPIDDLPAIVDNLERSLVVFNDGEPSWLPDNIENNIFECSDQDDTHSMLYICAVDQLHRRIKHRHPTFARPEHLPSSTIVNAMRKRLAGRLRTGKRRCNHCRGVSSQKDKYRRRTHWLGCWARDVPGRCAACVAAQRRGCSFEEHGPPEGDAEDGDGEDEEEEDDQSSSRAQDSPAVPEAPVPLPPAELRKLDLESLVTLWYPVHEGFKDAVTTKDSTVYKRLLESSERLNTYMEKLSPLPASSGPGTPTDFERMLYAKWNHVYRGLDDVFRLFNADFTALTQQRLADMHVHVVELARRTAEFVHLYAESIPQLPPADNGEVQAVVVVGEADAVGEPAGDVGKGNGAAAKGGRKTKRKGGKEGEEAVTAAAAATNHEQHVVNDAAMATAAAVAATAAGVQAAFAAEA